ncbi:hypothetical protein CLOBOL_00737 [Enterocloster bolteae ATCC BAA-613]|uniref:Uncharacterized protein n=1 Tax=Enterocloster bolteae (strain ATCC BAA-613 / DSM 15670 / CCUG 46953 / JCM 12243 / WAL 16351) TaxID=411902 RepID=A8RIM4_ENTBW|nr:hypothetical protein CLOBOL_00737 [Enterocloster bolteae ATCC BAA-613]
MHPSFIHFHQIYDILITMILLLLFMNIRFSYLYYT